MRKLLPLALVTVTACTQAQTMKPGLWEITSQVAAAGMPAMPAMTDAQRRQMEAAGIRMPAMAGGPMVVSVKHCVTKEDAERRIPPPSDDDRKNRCEQREVKTSGATTSWKIECSGENKMSGSGSLTLESPEGYRGESKFTTQGGKHGPMSMQQSFSGKFISANCK